MAWQYGWQFFIYAVCLEVKMSNNFKIEGGHFVNDKGLVIKNKNLLIIDGKILFTIPPTQKDNHITKINARNKFILPGLVDMRCHIGSTASENIKMINLSATKGGFTSLVAMPDFTTMADNPGAVRLIKDSVRKESNISIHATGCITAKAEGERLAPLGSLKEAGIVAVTDCPRCPQNNEIFAKGIEYAKMFNLPVIDLPREYTLSKDGAAHDGPVALKLGLKPFPRAAEEMFVQRAIILSKYINTPIHLSSISSRGSVDLIRIAKQNGVRISADVTSHHLLLSEKSILGFDTNCKTSPPLRQEVDRISLIEALIDGTIDGICSSHQPIPNHKKNIEFDLSPCGVLGLSTALPVAHRALSKYCEEKQIMSLITRTMTIAPSNILGLEKEFIEEGKKADLIIYDPQKKWKYDPSHECTEIINSPFDSCIMKGKVIKTFANGNLVYSSS